MEGMIISGGSVDERLALDFYRKGLPVIAADRGMQICRKLGIPIEEIVGDFDSSSEESLRSENIAPIERESAAYPEKYGEAQNPGQAQQTDEPEDIWAGASFYRDPFGTPVRIFPAMKDWTDTDIAVRLGIEKGWTRIYVLGATGTRLDHVLGNLQVMEKALEKGCHVILADPHNRIRMIRSHLTLKKEEQWGHYVSLVPWGGPVEGLTITGFVYDVSDFLLPTDRALGISNQMAQDQAQIDLKSGRLLVIESRD